jgi:hypothetical protein
MTLQRYHRFLRLRLACGCPVLIPTRHRRVATALAGQLLAYYIRHPRHCQACDRTSPAVELLGVVSPARPARPASR